MLPHREKPSLTVALVGNPNTGKSTLFSTLVGVRQRVGNYPGVTVEKKTGRMDHAGRRYEFIDLPGLYSLAPRSRDEMVAVDLLLGRRGDSPPVQAVVCIVDAANIERNLYLVSQVLELGLPTVVAVNMVDVAEGRGIRVDVQRLAQQLGVPVVATQANRRIGLSPLKRALAEVADSGPRRGESPFPEPFEREAARLESWLAEHAAEGKGGTALPRCLVRRLLLDTGGYLEKMLLADAGGQLDSQLGDELGRQLEAARARLAEADCAVPAIETEARYDWARRVTQGVLTQPSQHKTTATDRIDRLLTHRIWGTVLFALLMVVVFQSVFVWARPAMDLIEAAADAARGWVKAGMAEGALQSLLADGVISGVGGVLAFLPQILVLFLFIGVLEDCGYMARGAYLMDKLMVRAGLSGKSFIPMLSSFACAIPGIMATRVIEEERDRLTTILVAPLMTCSARLPVYALLIAAFIPEQAYFGGLLNLQGLTLLGLYLLGIVTAVVAALVFKRTILRGRPPPFLMELPGYKWPSPPTVVYRVVQRGWVFVRCAGTLILAVSILVWAALYFPHNAEVVDGPFQARQQQRQSILGQMGQIIEPVVRPLGWDWRIGCAVIASFPAREIVVATMGVIYIDPGSKQGSTLEDRLREAKHDDTGEPVFTTAVALSILVFFALCCQCAATLAVIRRETNSWRWPLFTFAYMTTLAYAGAFVTYRVGTWLAGL